MKSNAKIQLLSKAEDILTKSVEKNSKRNWFAYATTQIVRRDIVNSLRTEDSSKEQYIKLAIEDGHQCFLSKGTLKDMTILADMCQKCSQIYMNVDRNLLGTSIIYAKQYIICIMEIVSGIHQNTIQPPEWPPISLVLANM
jgi:hypothetical protein